MHEANNILNRSLSSCYSRHQFRLSYYPHRIIDFKKLLTDVFSKESTLQTYADFEPEEGVENPGYYIHLMHKKE